MPGRSQTGKHRGIVRLSFRIASVFPPILALFLAGLLLLGSSAGCAGVSAREAWLKNEVANLHERHHYLNGLSAASGAVLLSNGLLARAAADPAGTANELESRLSARAQTQPDGALALAELSYQAGLERDSWAQGRQTAIPWYRDAAALSWMALADPTTSERGLAVAIHNGAIARLVRTARMVEVNRRINWRDFFDSQKIAYESSESYLDPLQIADVRVAADLNVKGMDHLYRHDGFGVPVVVHRVATDMPDAPTTVENKYLPRELRTSATALMVTDGKLAGGGWRRTNPRLLLIDPFDVSSVSPGGRPVDMAQDFSTALASQVAGNRIAVLEWTGLLDSDFQKLGVDTGLYMLHPYEPGKIPVVFVHGLSSSPRAWVQTVNELRNNPDLAARYQFWVFMYPSGLPIPVSARSLRESLIQIRKDLDSEQSDPALDNMVVVGHSMGGMLAKMMAQNTGDEFWNALITVPRDQFKASPEQRKFVEDMLVFEPLPFVRRVVFIATPHRGSPIANGPIGTVFSAIIKRPAATSESLEEIEALNGPSVFAEDLKHRPLNSIGNLRTDSPILLTLDRIPIDPSVPYHSIIPLVAATTNTDLVVPYRSSRINGARSEQIVPGTHFSQQDPTVTHELKRILRLHLAASPAPKPTSGDAASDARSMLPPALAPAP